MQNKLVFVIAGIGSIVIMIWLGAVLPYLITTNEVLEITAQNVGEIQFADTVGGELSAPTKMMFEWKRTITNSTYGIVIINTVYNYRDLITNETFWITELEEGVFRDTRQYVNKDGYFMFPPNLQQKDYSVYDVGGAIMPYKFEGMEDFDGLTVYKFTGTVTFEVSDIYPDLSHTIYEDYSATNYVEPVTGLEVSFSEQFQDYALIDGQKVLVLNASDSSTNFSESILTKQASDLKTLHHIYRFFIPILMAVITGGSSYGIFLYNKSKLKQKQLQAELLKSEKLATIGQLSARVAHDIRNPLNVLKMGLELIKNKQPTQSEIQPYISKMDKAIDRISFQVNTVLANLKGTKSDLQIVNITDLLKDVQERFSNHKNIQITIPQNPYTAKINQDAIRTVFENLFRNAIESIGDESGYIKVSITEQVDQSKGQKNLTIKIEDSGPGIPSENINKIFDPLFTTKQTGTGLGLVSCKTIVESHGGNISVNNNPTTFTINLPKGI